uniref:RNA-directed DNA polymerase from mobile element jockey-like n=1 Tax=Hirondellea gigas TaxID=1518452 RepID=A0A2P2HYG4_9CRUS
MLSVRLETDIGLVEIGTAYVPFRIGYLHYPDYYRFFNRSYPSYFLGDMNARSAALGHRNDNTMGIQLATLVNRNHAQHIGPNFPTFITHRSKSSPDIILGNKHMIYNYSAEPGQLTPSDHIPIIFTISTNPIQVPIRERSNFRKADWRKYSDQLGREDIINLTGATVGEIEEKTAQWTKVIQTIGKENIPVTKYRTLPHIKTTHEVRILKIAYLELYREIDREGASMDRYRELIELRRKLRDEFNRLRTEQWNDLIKQTDLEHKSKDFWASIKTMLGTNTTNQQRYIKDHNDKEIYEDKDKEVIFRKYWEKIFQITPEENKEFDKETDTKVNQYIDDNLDRYQTLEEVDLDRLYQQTNLVTIEELNKTIASFKHKSPGIDEITKYHLINLPNKMLINLLKIINSCLSIGYFPKIWKTSIIIFIPKPNKSPFSHVNYRPISLLSIPGKILEKIINRRLIKAITTNSLQNEAQHGFRIGLGTGTATALFYEAIAAGRANRLKMNVVLRDISKAFDKVWHRGLFYKIGISQIPEFLARIIYSYLENRVAKIKIGNYIGKEINLLSGVPQGGCLSPTLFNFYTHDVPEAGGQSINIIYADDITQIVSYPGSENMLAKITANEVEKINNYENKWKIKTNETKFQIIPIGRTRAQKVKIGQKEHDFSLEGKMLGLKFNRYGFVGHVQDRIRLARVELGRIFRFRELSWNNLRKLYYALVLSKLLYPIVPLYTISKTQQRKLQIVQNKAARIITGIRLREGIGNQTVNELAELTPLNINIHNQAKKIWNQLEPKLSDRIKNRIDKDEGRTELKSFPLSRKKVQGPEPEPLY